MARIDDAVERILRLKFTAGLFEHPYSDRSLLKFVGYKEHREIAREAARKSLVLLKNGKDYLHPKKNKIKDSEKLFLRLDRNAKKILVAGSHAEDIGFQCGGWSKTFQNLSGPITIETQDDDPEPSIHFDGTEVMRLVAEKIPTVAILITGRPVVLDPTVLEKVEALVAAWLPGTEGDGITEVVFGDYDFIGKLPMSWFRTAPMNPEVDGYDPLFPIGFGLKCKK